MLKFFDFCEASYQSMEDKLEPTETALAMFEQAKSSVEPDSIYSKRLGLIDNFLEALRSKAGQLAQGRGPVAKVRTVWDPKVPIVIDGKLDDEYWLRHKDWSVAPLRELQSGGRPVFGTSVMAGWDRSGQNLYFAIRCEDRPGEELNVTATKHDDEAIWYGDVVEILLDTDSHSYYQIAVNPAGALADLDRGAGKSSRFRWESQAEVATHVAADHWIVEIRIPVTDDENDPLNHVIGRKPSQSLPWHFNICRQRARKTGTELSAISPTGKAGFHEPLKFAHFHSGGSHSFEVDETVTDFLIEFTAAAKLQRGRKYAEAQAAFTTLADYPKATDFQKSRALAEAATCARLLKKYEEASELATQIPLTEIAKTTRMEILLDQRSWNEIVEQFGDENLSQWPFTQIGAAAFARGRAYYGVKNGEKADGDYQLALEFTSDPRTHASILSAMARNRETVLKDDDRALETYRRIAASKTNTGGAEYYSGLQGAARLLTRRGEFDNALKILDQVDAEKLVGSWASSMMLSRATTLQAAEKKDEALKTYRAVLANDSAQKGQKAAAQKGIDSIVQAK